MIVSAYISFTCARTDYPKFATTPFKGPNRNATFANVLKNEVGFPDSPAVTRWVRFRPENLSHADLSSLCKSAIRKLLIKDEHKRLGSNSGASEVKQHKWFSNVNWGLLRHMTPPVSSDQACVGSKLIEISPTIYVYYYAPYLLLQPSTPLIDHSCRI
jgi:serine/threonine protein kinase